MGTDQANQATDDDYELRRTRTPVPTLVAEGAEAHLARICSRKAHRDGPDRLFAWFLTTSLSMYTLYTSMFVISIILRCRLARKFAPRPIRFAWGSTPAWPRTYFPRTWPGELCIGWAIIQ